MRQCFSLKAGRCLPRLRSPSNLKRRDILRQIIDLNILKQFLLADCNAPHLHQFKELVERLLEYKMYKYISQELKDRQMDAAMLLFKGRTLPSEIEEYKEEIRAADLLAGLTLSKLHAVFESVIKRQNDKIDPIRSRFGRIESHLSVFQFL